MFIENECIGMVISAAAVKVCLSKLNQGPKRCLKSDIGKTFEKEKDVGVNVATFFSKTSADLINNTGMVQPDRIPSCHCTIPKCLTASISRDRGKPINLDTRWVRIFTRIVRY